MFGCEREMWSLSLERGDLSNQIFCVMPGDLEHDKREEDIDKELV